jgi:hypothetical protein
MTQFWHHNLHLKTSTNNKHSYSNSSRFRCWLSYFKTIFLNCKDISQTLLLAKVLLNKHLLVELRPPVNNNSYYKLWCSKEVWLHRLTSISNASRWTIPSINSKNRFLVHHLNQADTSPSLEHLQTFLKFLNNTNTLFKTIHNYKRT